MALLEKGRDFIAAAIINSGSPTFFVNATCCTRVGNNSTSTAYAANQTDLQGASKLSKAMDATYPSVATNVITFQSTFTTSEANFAWEEWGIANGSATPNGTTCILLNRKVESNGTKQSGQTWVFQTQLTIAIGTS